MREVKIVKAEEQTWRAEKVCSGSRRRRRSNAREVADCRFVSAQVCQGVKQDSEIEHRAITSLQLICEQFRVILVAPCGLYRLD